MVSPSEKQSTTGDLPTIPLWRVFTWFLVELIEHIFYLTVRASANLLGLFMLLRERMGIRSFTVTIGSPLATDSGADANAGAVGLFRYLHCMEPDVYPDLDPEIKKFEWLFMSSSTRFLARMCGRMPTLLRTISQFEGGLLAARTVLMDLLMVDFLTGTNLVKNKIGSSHDDQVGDAEDDDPDSASTTHPPRGSRLETETTSSSPSSGGGANQGTDNNNNNTDDAASRPRIKRQVLILGAGFDSRPYRLRALLRQTSLTDDSGAGANNDENSDVNVIEIDQSTVQATKIGRLVKNLGTEKYQSLTANVEYVSCNFEHPSALREALLNSKSFDPSLPTFVLWEGVTYYLPLVAVRNTLECLSTFRQLSSVKSKWVLVFDFIDDMSFVEWRRVSQQLMWAAIGAVNHPCKSCLPKDIVQMRKFLGEYKLQVQDIWACKEVVSRLFPRIEVARDMCGISFASCRWVDEDVVIGGRASASASAVPHSLRVEKNNPRGVDETAAAAARRLHESRMRHPQQQQHSGDELRKQQRQQQAAPTTTTTTQPPAIAGRS